MVKSTLLNEPGGFLGIYVSARSNEACSPAGGTCLRLVELERTFTNCESKRRSAIRRLSDNDACAQVEPVSGLTAPSPLLVLLPASGRKNKQERRDGVAEHRSRMLSLLSTAAVTQKTQPPHQSVD